MHPFFVFVTLVAAMWADTRNIPRRPTPVIPPPITVTPFGAVFQNGVWYTVH